MERTIGRVAVALGAVVLLGCQTTSSVLTGLGGDIARMGANIPMTVEFAGVPATESEFDSVWAGLQGSPADAAGGFVIAALMLERNPELGQRCLLKTVAADYLTSDGRPGASLSFGIRQLLGRAAIARSYVQETFPPGYALPASPLKVVFYADAAGTSPGPNREKVFVVSSGADSRRPVSLVKTVGGWRVVEGSSLWLGVR